MSFEQDPGQFVSVRTCLETSLLTLHAMGFACSRSPNLGFAKRRSNEPLFPHTARGNTMSHVHTSQNSRRWICVYSFPSFDDHLPPVRARWTSSTRGRRDLTETTDEISLKSQVVIDAKDRDSLE